MSANSGHSRPGVLNFLDELAQEVVELSREEIQSEFSAEEIKDAGNWGREVLQRAQREIGKRKLRAAREALDAHRTRRDTKGNVIDITAKRKRVEALLSQGGASGERVTLAARYSQTDIKSISDSDIESMFEQFKRLGAWADDEEH